MLIKVFGAAVQGIDATLITIEVNSSRGCMFYLVGLPDSAVKESHQRIISALQVNGYRMPTSNIVINMAPADIRKEGSAYDLPLAIGMLGASEVIQSDKTDRYLIMGELSLDGSLQPIKGALPIAIKARELGFEGIIIPKQNTREAAVVNNLQVYGAENLKEVIEFFNGKQELKPVHIDTRKEFYTRQNSFDLDFSDVKGQENAKRALEVAAAGGHNILLVGAPGSGKSMLAKRLPSILPPLSLGESLETTKIHSVAGKLGQSALMGPIAVAAYSYMSLVPIIQPPIMKLLTTEKERKIKMGQLRPVSKLEKILFPIIVTIIVALTLPDAAILVGCLMMGNLMKESGVVERITKTAGNELMNIITIFLGFSVGCTTNAATFLNIQTVEIIVLGIVAFGVGTAGGVILGKVMCVVTHGKINPLIGSAGVSAVPMAARVSQKVGQEYNPRNYLLMHAMGPNVAGVIGSAVAAGILINMFG